MTVVELAPLELVRTLHHMRQVRTELEAQQMQLQERLTHGGDGVTHDAILALENELYVVAEVVRKLWAASVL